MSDKSKPDPAAVAAELLEECRRLHRRALADLGPEGVRRWGLCESFGVIGLAPSFVVSVVVRDEDAPEPVRELRRYVGEEIPASVRDGAVSFLRIAFSSIDSELARAAARAHEAGESPLTLWCWLDRGVLQLLSWPKSERFERAVRLFGVEAPLTARYN